jgi:hypothetical protein
LSTTPTPVVPLPSKLKADYTWLIHHAVLLLIVVGLAAGLFYEINNVIEKHDIARQNADQQTLSLVTQQTTDLRNQLTQDEAQAATRDAQKDAEIKSLTTLIAQQSQQLAQQKQVDATLTAQETASAISQKMSAAPGEVTANGDNVVTDLQISRILNSDIDELFTDRKQIPEFQTKLQDQITLTQDAQTQLGTSQKVIASQTTELAQADKVCSDKIAVEKAKARKKGFWAAIGGFIGGIIAGHALGI